MNTNYAGFWLRFVAYLIDSVILGCIQFILIMPVLAIFGIGAVAKANGVDFKDDAATASFIAGIMAFAFLYAIVYYSLKTLYHSLMESSKYQGSVGKLALSLRVTDTEGNRVGFGKALLRNIAKVVSDWTMAIGYIIAGFTAKKQALHDLIASTLVVQKQA